MCVWGGGGESILQAVVWFTFSKPMLNYIQQSDYSPYMYYQNGLK